jgi:RNA polymerase-binding transcription factor DksA
VLVERVTRELDDAADLLSERDPDWEDLAARHGLAELLDRFSARDLEELARIDAALRRVDDGTYGRCTSCGQQIAVDRLLALPEADTCADCAALEQPSAPV